MKSEIIRELGEGSMLLPSLIRDGLAANDRIKVRMSALQAAAQRAARPEAPITDLSAESRAAGLAAPTLAALIEGARAAGDSCFTAPHLAELIGEIAEDATTMIRSVAAGDPKEGEAASARLAAIRAAGLLAPCQEIETARVAVLTGAHEGRDSLHRLVMDLHKSLNRLAAACAEDVVEGAHVFGLEAADRAAVEAFMRGLNATRGLKFNHPGLDTMAMRAGNRLLIQNDIGTTDAHVVVIAVENNTVTVTYTDVHLVRAKFFIGLFDKHRAQWSGLDRHAAAGLGEENAFFLVTGRFEGESMAERDDFLASIGSSLVFLIDWNKARKLLHNYIAKDDSIRVLDWAARHRIGHRAFLELGGNALLSAAVRSAASTRIGFGERLDQALGRTAAIDFLKSTLRSSTEGLSAGQSARLVRDRIEAELVRHLDRVDNALLAAVLRQVGLAQDLVAAISRHVAALSAGRPADAKHLAARAAHIEQKADRIALEARNEAARLDARPVIGELIDVAERAIDELEQAAFIASLVPSALDARLLPALSELCAIAMAATEAAASGLAAAAQVPEGRRADSEDALTAVVRLIDAEHAADTQERAVTALVFASGFDVATSLSMLELARAIERSTDRFAGFGHLLRQHIMADLSA